MNDAYIPQSGRKMLYYKKLVSLMLSCELCVKKVRHSTNPPRVFEETSNSSRML